MGSSPSTLGNVYPLEIGKRDHAIEEHTPVSDENEKTANIKQDETMDDSLRSRHSSMSVSTDNERKSSDDGLSVTVEEKLEQFKIDCSNRLQEIGNRVTQFDVNSVNADTLEESVTDDIRFIHDIYSALLNVVARKELESFRKDTSQRLLDLKIFVFMESVIKQFSVAFDIENATNREHAAFSLVNLIIMALFNYTDASETLAVAIANSQIIEFCKAFLEKRSSEHLKTGKHDAMEHFLFCVHGLVHNVSVRDINVERLQEMGFTNVLQPYLKSHNEEISMVTLTTLANIVKEDECDIIAANVLLVARLLMILLNGLESENHRYLGWSCKECGLAVRKLARNDANKKLLWNLNVLGVLVKLAKTDDLEEQTESVNAIWALAFDEDVRKDIANNKETGVMELLLDLKESSTSESLKNAVNKCLWTLKDDLKTSKIKSYRRAVEAIPEIPKMSTREGHIMISYQSANRETLKKIKDKLNKQDYQVWMDIDQMGGSTLQAMAEAVEHASVILLCFSRRYKESDNCRLEAEYAHERKKPIIPLKMEQGYKPDGWLGLMIGSKYFVEFSGKYSFETKLDDLYKQIRRVLEPDSSEPQHFARPSPVQVSRPVIEEARDEVDSAPKDRRMRNRSDVMSRLSFVRQWTIDDISNWLTKHNLSSEQLRELTGEEISFLASTLHEAPEHLHRYLRKDLKIKSLLEKSRMFWALQEVLDGRN